LGLASQRQKHLISEHAKERFPTTVIQQLTAADSARFLERRIFVRFGPMRRDFLCAGTLKHSSRPAIGTGKL
jgi:hypothetical protein